MGAQVRHESETSGSVVQLRGNILFRPTSDVFHRGSLDPCAFAFLLTRTWTCSGNCPYVTGVYDPRWGNIDVTFAVLLTLTVLHGVQQSNRAFLLANPCLSSIRLFASISGVTDTARADRATFFLLLYRREEYVRSLKKKVIFPFPAQLFLRITGAVFRDPCESRETGDVNRQIGKRYYHVSLPSSCLDHFIFHIYNKFVVYLPTILQRLLTFCYFLYTKEILLFFIQLFGERELEVVKIGLSWCFDLSVGKKVG